MIPCVLIEYAFYTNKEDLKILKNNKDALVEATIKSICKYFNVTYKAPTSAPVTSNDVLYAVCVGAYKKENADKMKEELISKGYKDTYFIKR